MKVVSLVLCLMLVAASCVFAETVYLKDGTLLRGKISQEDASTVIIENKDTWRRIEKNNIELIKRDDQSEQVKPAGAEGEQEGEKPNQSAQFEAGRENSRRPGPLYFGFQMPFNMIKGDFDGRSAPAVDGGLGFGFIFGYAFTTHFAAEIDWAGSSHKSGTATIGFGEFSLNGKLIVPISDQVQPYVIAGWGQYTLGDETLLFSGKGYNFGLGVDIYRSDRLSLGAAMIRKVITYDRIEDSNRGAKLYKSIDGETSSIRLDLAFHF